MPSPRFPNFPKSGYKKVVDAELWNERKPASQCGDLARRYCPDYRIAFFAMCALYFLSMSAASTIILFPELFQRNSVRPSTPDIPRDETVVFNGYRAFESPRTKNDAWSKLMPSGKGFVEIPVEVPLKDGRVEVRTESFCISMFHQLHCIAGLKKAFEDMQSDEQPHPNHGSHLDHCFDYLRQGVMCAGDMTLEPAFELDGDDVGTRGVNGWNVAHQCRNYQTMYDFAEEHRFQNSSGIL